MLLTAKPSFQPLQSFRIFSMWWWWCAHARVEVRGPPLLLRPLPPPCLREGLSSFSLPCMPGWLTRAFPEDSPICLTPPSKGVLTSDVGSGDLNSGCRACVASQTHLSPAPRGLTFSSVLHVCMNVHPYTITRAHASNF